MNQFHFKSYNKGNSWLGIIIIVAIIFFIFFIIQNLYKLFALLAPIFLILTAILDYRVIAKFGIVIYELLRYRTVLGILAVIFSIIGLPFVSAAMFFNAFMNFKTKRRNKKRYIDYEDVSDKDDDILILEDKDKVKLDDYENLFD
ncbi:MAG TPA: hypothetical protein ENI82_03180 [Bacteroidetes bacterium]|nr:hypothetical protein [Bacteroidota bacterium]